MVVSSNNFGNHIDVDAGGSVVVVGVRRRSPDLFAVRLLFGVSGQLVGLSASSVDVPCSACTELTVARSSKGETSPVRLVVVSLRFR